MNGSARLAYQYVALRCVPRAEREEFVNLGVVLYCEAAGFLRAAWSVDADRLRALDPSVDVGQVCAGLAFVDQVCSGASQAGALAKQPPGVRFGHLIAPRSTVLRPGPVHGGLTRDPEAELPLLLARLVGA